MNTLLEALAYIDEGLPGHAHVLVQDLRTPEAAYVHGMIHRDEGDLGNARYWFSRAGDIPARLGFDPMSVEKDVERDALAQLLES